MVRNYKPKTDRIHINEENIKHAVREVLSKTLSIRKAAAKYDIKSGTLQNRIQKSRQSLEASITSSSTHTAAFLSQETPSTSQIAPTVEMALAASSTQHPGPSTSHITTPTASKTYGSKYTASQVFSIEQEKALIQYLLNCSKMDEGLTLIQLLTLAYEYAEACGCKFPKSWKENKRAGRDWAAGFRSRNPEIRLRKLKNTARSCNSNKIAEELRPINELNVNDFVPINTFSTDDMTDEAVKLDAKFVDTETSHNDEPVDIEQINSSTLEIDLEPVSDADDPLNFFSLKGILSSEAVRHYPKKSVTENVPTRNRIDRARSRIYTRTQERNSLQSFRKELQKLKQQVKELKATKKLLELTDVKKENRMISLPPELDSDSSHDEVVTPCDSEDNKVPSELKDEEHINDSVSQSESLLQTKIEVDSDVDQHEQEASTSNPWWSAPGSRTSPDDVPKSVNEPSVRTDNKNRFKVFGQYVGIRLQELPQQQRILAEKVINEALFLAEMGSLTTSHSVRN